MSLAQWIMLGLKISIIALVLSIGLRASFSDVLYLFRRPSMLLRSLLAMNILMLLFAVILATVFELNPAVKITLVALALSPVPPILPKKGFKMGGHVAHAIGLLVAVALLSIVITPVFLELLGIAFNLPLHLSPALVFKLVLITVLLPLGAGITIRHFAPTLAERIAGPLEKIASLLLLLCALLIIIKAWPAMMSLIGDGSVLAILAFILFGLAAGVLLGGPKQENRTTLSLATASRHPGIAMAIAYASFPEQKLVTAAIFLYLLLNTIVGIPYGYWRRSRLGTNNPEMTEILKPVHSRIKQEDCQ